MATAAPSLMCDPCKDCGEEQVPVVFCLECRELYCKTCLNGHKKTTVTNLHLYAYLTGDKSGEICPCDLCDADNKTASSLCNNCRQLYCSACTNRHRKLKATKNHVIVDIISDKSADISSELATCSLGFNVTYSGAQVPVNKRDKPIQQDCKLENSKTTDGSEPLHSDNTARRSDVKQTSLSGTFQRMFSVRTRSDKESNFINRMISMPDDRICVVDYHNDTIKLYRYDFLLCDEVSVPGCTAVTCVDDDTVAIATDSDITRYSVKENKFILKRNLITRTAKTIHIDGYIYDIAYRRGEFITRYAKDKTDYTCCGSKLIVKQDRELILNDFMHYDPVTDCVILSNNGWSDEDHNVTCYTLDGNAKWRITLDVLLRGIVVVHSIVLVADCNNDTVRQITMDGRLLSTPLLTKHHGIVRPYAITYQHKQHRLLVPLDRNDKVMVFHLFT